MGDELLFHGFIPQTGFSEVLEEMVVDHLELPRENATAVDVTGVGLYGLVIPQDLSC